MERFSTSEGGYALAEIKSSMGLKKTTNAKKNSTQKRICTGTGKAAEVVGRNNFGNINIMAMCTTLSAMDDCASVFVGTFPNSLMV